MQSIVQELNNFSNNPHIFSGIKFKILNLLNVLQLKFSHNKLLHRLIIIFNEKIFSITGELSF